MGPKFRACDICFKHMEPCLSFVVCPYLERCVFSTVRRLVWHLLSLVGCFCKPTTYGGLFGTCLLFSRAVFFATLWRLVYRLIVSRAAVFAPLEARLSPALSRAMVLTNLLWRLVSRPRSLVHCFLQTYYGGLFVVLSLSLSLSLPFGRCKKKYKKQHV